ncbi:MAG: phage protein NinX family protein, partial [Halomonas sp.]|nr:phage protein NinX family protein [Halomonas sp.]
MRIKTSELEGKALDWAVAEAINLPERDIMNGVVVFMSWFDVNKCRAGDDFCPSTDWSQGGPLFEKYIDWHDELDGIRCRAWPHGKACEWAYGSTLLIAAMR